MCSTVEGLEQPRFKISWSVFLLKSHFQLGRTRVAAASVSAPPPPVRPPACPSGGARPFSSLGQPGKALSQGAAPTNG